MSINAIAFQRNAIAMFLCSWACVIHAGSCPAFKVTDYIQGIESIYKSCLKQARNGDASAQWSVSVLTSYMLCNSTPETRIVSDEWRTLAINANFPDAILNSAIDELMALWEVQGPDRSRRVQRAFGDLKRAAKLGSADAYYELYRFYDSFKYAQPPIRGLGNHSQAVDHLLLAAKLGSAQAAEELGAAYSWKATTDRGATSAYDEMWPMHSDRLLIDELRRKGKLVEDHGEEARRYLEQAASAGNWDAADKLIEGYKNDTFGEHDPVRLAAWSIVRDLHVDEGTQSVVVNPKDRKNVCATIHEITALGSIFKYHRPVVKEPSNDEFRVGDCLVLPEVPQGPSCLQPSSVVPP